jgi:hypothetical protein
MNLIFEATGPKSTRVTVSTRYVVSKQVTVQQVGAGFPSQSGTDTISFTTGGTATFPGAPPATRCVPSGVLEQEILDAVE